MPSDEPTLIASNDEHCNFDNCVELAVCRCHKCNKLFCIDHASEVDPTHYCVDCITPADCEVIEMPLLDRDGTRHRGKLLRPIGQAFIENNKLISELSEDELRAFISQYQQLLHDAERVTNLYRISLTQATHEALSREIMKPKPKGEPGEFVFTDSPRQVKAAKQTKSLEDKLTDAMAKAGITPEKLREILAKRKSQAS
jgi:hypothetical protein